MTPPRLLRLALAAFVFVSGCAGPLALQHSRQKYSEAVQVTNAEQLLLNLVRLRYRDTPSFLELSSLSTQFAFEESGFVGVDVPEAGLNLLKLNTAIQASERPTVTYDPLRGQEFVKRLISPLNEETIILLIRSGWSIERVLRMTVQDINGLENARRASGPTPGTISQEEYHAFQQAVQSLREFQISNQIRIGYEESQEQLSGSIPADKVTSDAFVEAARDGWKLQPKQERVSIAVDKIAPSSNVTADYFDPNLFQNLVADVKARNLRTPIRVMWRESWVKKFGREPGTDGFFDRISKSMAPESREELPAPPPLEAPRSSAPFVAIEGEQADLMLAAYRAASVKRIPCIVEFPDYFVLTGTTQSLVMNWDAEDSELNVEALETLPGLINVEEEKYTLSIEPRSLMGVMYYLSHAIRVPPSHEASGLVRITMDDTDGSERVFDWAELTGDLLHVQWSDKKPDCASVAVRYRDVWFYIDDRDQRSKATFTLLMQLFELQAGGGATGTRPVLTLPVGV